MEEESSLHIPHSTGRQHNWTSDHWPIVLETNPFKWGPTPFRRDLSPELLVQRALRKGELEELILREEIHWRQKARVKWVKEGDCNSKFFHKVANGRQNRKFIKVLENDRGLVLNNSESIKEETLKYFEKLYASPSGESWRVEGLDWSLISSESASRLESPFTEKEISYVIFQLDRDKAPGLDGFTIAVFQDCWDVIKEDLVRVFAEFHKILVNGNAKAWVKASRCLRQGDPLSPFLFTLVANVLSRMLLRAEEINVLEGFRVGRNRTKVGRDARLQGFWEPILYLGLPLGGNPKACGFWDPVIEKISRRLDGWKKAYLSFGGGITLIQFCLTHMPCYFLSLFKIPASVAAKIERLQRDFLWSGVGEGKRDHLVSWDVVYNPKTKGGLGFGKISIRNFALLGK
ncbi:putative ribonuclease H protein [Vitis vinifera]|uniref:Putative ribonuclease H protein n=1 Tax=Vitis vinifera TaxID=29760 RepID=A0A438HQ12_VITVI|nr:putative ribonuclease H protein [Vitis vinifera]